ncbi:MAG: hypothetical protein IJU72_01955 [Bacteroidales bacterium]|nr:hypothetical protein [Bacteroidales bacterium]
MKKLMLSLLVASSISMVACNQAPKKQTAVDEPDATEIVAVEEEVPADSISAATTEATEEQTAE